MSWFLFNPATVPWRWGFLRGTWWKALHYRGITPGQKMWDKVLDAAVMFDTEQAARIAKDKVSMYERQHGRGQHVHVFKVVDLTGAEQHLVEHEIQK